MSREGIVLPFMRRTESRQSAWWPRIAVAICAAVLLGMCASYVLLVQSGAAGPKKTDFVPYYAAARLLLQGHGAWLYSLPAVGHVEATVVYPLHVSHGVMPYLYPPYFALILAPFAALQYEAAFYLWLGINLALLILTIALLQRFLNLRGIAAAVLWAGALSFFPVLVSLAQGQASVLLLSIFVLALLAIRNDHEIWAGIALSLALIKPPYLLPVLVVLLAARHWRVLLSFGCASIALLSAPLFVIGPNSGTAYLSAMANAGGWQQQIGGFAPRWNQSIAGFAQLLVPGSAATFLTWGCALGGLGFLGWYAARSRSIEISFALACVAALLLSPHVLIHDLTLLILPAAVASHHRGPGKSYLPHILVGGYAAVIAGLALVTVTHVQLSVVAMTCLVWPLVTFGLQPISNSGSNRSASIAPPHASADLSA